MTKTSEEILLEEVKAEYARQITHWNELNRKYHSFLHTTVLLLTIFFVGTNFIKINPTSESFNLFTSLPLVIFSIFIILFTIMIIFIFIIFFTSIKEIKVDLDDDNDLKNKESDIILSLIKVYNIAQKDIISKHKTKAKYLAVSSIFLISGISSLFFLLFSTYISIFNQVFPTS